MGEWGVGDEMGMLEQGNLEKDAWNELSFSHIRI